MIITSKSMNLDECPVRHSPHRRRQNFIVSFPSLKNGRSMECESVLESAYCIWLEYFPNVLKYYTQPHTFIWIDETQRYHYTPDFFVILKNGQNFFCEVKHDFTTQRVSRLDKLESFHRLCKQEGWIFHRHDQRSITASPTFQSIKTLYSRSRYVNEQQEMHFRNYSRARSWPTTLGELTNDKTAPDVSTICYYLFTKRLIADLTQRITLSLRVDWENNHA